MKCVENFFALGKQRFKTIFTEMDWVLNEKDKRLLVAVMAKALGTSGKQIVQMITGFFNETIKLGYNQLTGREYMDKARIRRESGGRKLAVEIYPEIEQYILEIVETDTKGNPERPLLWTSKSLKNISDALSPLDYEVSVTQIAKILKKNGYSLQANKKGIEGIGSLANLSRQFEIIN